MFARLLNIGTSGTAVVGLTARAIFEVFDEIGDKGLAAERKPVL